MIPSNPIKLKGFATNVQANMSMFDTCLKQLQCKYGGQMQVSVEATLGMLLLRCAVTVHTANVASEADEARRKEEEDARVVEIGGPEPKPPAVHPDAVPVENTQETVVV